MSVFQFKQFSILQKDVAMKVGTDAMLLGALMDVSGKMNGLDIGTGTGVLSLMAIQNNTKLLVDALELDAGSFATCQSNFEASPWPDQLIAHHVDFLDFQTAQTYDLIFSNPPYYLTTLKSYNEREAQAKHVKTLTPENLIKKVASLLTPKGTFWIIIPFSDSTVWINIAEHVGLFPSRMIEICGKEGDSPKRLVLCFQDTLTKPVIKPLTARKSNGAYTEAYIELTRNFHATKLSSGE